MPQLPISLQIRAPRSAGWLPGPLAVGPVPLLCSVPPGCLCPRRPREKKRPARPGGGTGHTSAGAPTLRSARAQGLSAHLRFPRVGGSAAEGAPRPREPQGPVSSRRPASPARPAPGRRAALRTQGQRTVARSIVSPSAPLPCPSPQRGPPPGSAAPRPLPRRAGMRSFRRTPAAPVPQPGGCSFFGEARKRERKKGGREGGGKALRSREREVCKGRKWRRPRPVREINGNQSPGSQQRNLLPQRSPVRAAAPPRPGSPGRPRHRSRRQRSAPTPRRVGAARLRPQVLVFARQEEGEQPGSARQDGPVRGEDAMGRGRRREPRPAPDSLLPPSTPKERYRLFFI